MAFLLSGVGVGCVCGGGVTSTSLPDTESLQFQSHFPAKGKTTGLDSHLGEIRGGQNKLQSLGVHELPVYICMDSPPWIYMSMHCCNCAIPIRTILIYWMFLGDLDETSFERNL